MNWNNYYDKQERDEIWENLMVAIKEINYGRNRDCFPVLAFGWKDADLDPEGCTGIENLEFSYVTKPTMLVTISGHKTFVPPEWVDGDRYNEAQKKILVDDIGEVLQHIVCDIGYPGDWTGDDWVLYVPRETFAVELIFDNEIGEYDYKASAKLIKEKAYEKLKPFSDTMKEYSAVFCEEIREWRGDVE